MGKWDSPLGEMPLCLKTNKKHQMHNDYSKEKKATGLPAFKPEKKVRKKGGGEGEGCLG